MNCAFYYNRRTTRILPDSCGRRSLRCRSPARRDFPSCEGKVSEPFVLTPFRRAALIDCIALLQNTGGLPDVPRYLLNRLGEAESLLRLFLLEVPTRILYIDSDADGQPTFCAASSRVPQLLRSALWNTREPAILTSGTLGSSRRFQPHGTAFGAGGLSTLASFPSRFSV